MASSANQETTTTEIIGEGSQSITVKPPVKCLEEDKKLNNNTMKSGIVSQIMNLRVSQKKKNIITELGLDKEDVGLINSFFILKPIGDICIEPNIDLTELSSMFPFIEKPSMLYFENGGSNLTKFIKTDIHWLIKFRNILRGVEFLIEKNIVHGDIKFGNIVFNPLKNTDFKLIDFGIARTMETISSNPQFYNFTEDNWRSFVGIDLVIPLNSFLIYCHYVITKNLKERFDIIGFFSLILQNYRLYFKKEHYYKILENFYQEFFPDFNYFYEKEAEISKLLSPERPRIYTNENIKLESIMQHIDLYSIGLCLLRFCFQNLIYRKKEERTNIQEAVLTFIYVNKLLHQDLTPDDNFNINVVCENYDTLLKALESGDKDIDIERSRDVFKLKGGFKKKSNKKSNKTLKKIKFIKTFKSKKNKQKNKQKK